MMKAYLRTAIIVLLWVSVKISFAQSTDVRGIYISNINDIIASNSRTDSLLNYLKAYRFNYITLYSLQKINWSSTTEKNRLANFIKRARTDYGIRQVGASSEKYTFFTSNILTYNNSRTDSLERFNVLNFEFEFWIPSRINTYYCNSYLTPNGYSCDTSGAFEYSFRQFRKIDSLCRAKNLISEIYIGWPTTGQLQQIASVADRILVHAYRPSDADLYARSRNRLIGLASINRRVKVIPIFSSEPDFMKSWLTTNSITQPYRTYVQDFHNDTGGFKNYIDLEGYQWYVYSEMPKTIPPAATITANGPVSICRGQTVRLTASSGAAYQWSPNGETTRSITVSAAGSYAVTIYHTTGAVSTSSVVQINVNDVTRPEISANGPTSFCTGGNVTLTAPTAAAYQWSNGATTRSITVGQAGDYRVTTVNNSGCSATSEITRVKVNDPPAIPVITASSSTTICEGQSILMTSSWAEGYRWSTGDTTRSISVSSAGTYTVRAYSGPYCYRTSASKTVTILPAPAIPVIDINGSTELTTSNRSVQLRSSPASSYEWSNGRTTRQITVNSAGTLRVTVTGSNGCKSTSAPVVVTTVACTPPPVPEITYNGSLYLGPGDSVMLTAPSGYGYLWSDGRMTRTIAVRQPGTYSVRTYSASNCFSESLPVDVFTFPARYGNDDHSSELSINKMNMSFSFYPNPAIASINTLFFSEKKQSGIVTIIDLTGRKMFEKEYAFEPGNNHMVIDLNLFKQGVYFVMFSSDKFRQTDRLIIE